MAMISPAAIPPTQPARPRRGRALLAERGDGIVAAFGDDVTVHPGILAAVAWLRGEIAQAAAAGRLVTLGISCRDAALIADVFRPLGVTVISGAGTGSAALGDYVERVLGPAPEPEREPQQESRIIVAAADASWAPRRPGRGAWAAVRDDGKYITGWASAGTGKYGPEEQALRAAFRAWGRQVTRSGDRLVLLSDSVHAVSVTTEWLPNSGAGRFTRNRTEIRWVKGHAGHPLNEAADRLAVAARRMRPGRISRDFAAGIAREGAEEFSAGRDHWLGQSGIGDLEAA